MSDTVTRPGTRTKPKVERPRLHKVILVNDDFTPREFVVTVLKGEFGMSDLFLGVPCKLGRSGLEKVIEVELTDDERAALGKSADAVLETMALLS